MLETRRSGARISTKALGTGAAVFASAAAATGIAAPVAAASTYGTFCTVAGYGIDLNNPFSKGSPWTCTRWQQYYSKVYEVAAIWSYGLDGAIVGLTNGTSDWQHVSSAYGIKGSARGPGSPKNLAYYADRKSGYPFVHNAGRGVAQQLYQGYITYS